MIDNNKSSNTPEGWLHYYIAHLLDASGMWYDASETLPWVGLESLDAARWDWQHDVYKYTNRVSHPEWSRPYIGDMQCVMMTNKWFYAYNSRACNFAMFVLDDAGEKQFTGVVIPVIREEIEYWLAQMGSSQDKLDKWEELFSS
jgi:hypothetical protein